MKKTILMTLLWFTAGSVYVLAGQGDSANRSGVPGIHEARFNVFDYTTKKPVANAGFFNTSGAKLGQTDKKGILVLRLPATSSDIYTVRLAGFTPSNIRLTQAEKKSADYQVFLQPDKGENGIENAPSNVMKEEASTGDDLVKVYVRQDPAVYQQSREQTSSKVEFAVQLSASSKPVTNKNSLKSWEDLGHVYVHTENGLYKVRIGPFDTQEDAKAVLLQAKARGTKDAFIVVQKGLEDQKPFEFQSHPAEKSATVVNAQPLTPGESITTKDAPQGEYKVRLASYLHPGGFNTKDIDQYGKLESYRQGEWTIMLIGGFKNEADARKVRDQVIQKGYKDAAVVIDQDGILVETK